MVTMLSTLLREQWRHYADTHQTQRNLLTHILAVPLFLVGNIVLLYAVIHAAPVAGTVGIGLSSIGLALQGKGHSHEPMAPTPFTGIGNAVLRILLEQWITFPRFVFSGGWLAAWRNAR